MIVYFSLKALSKQLLISKALQSFVLIQARINQKNSGGGERLRFMKFCRPP